LALNRKPPANHVNIAADISRKRRVVIEQRALLAPLAQGVALQSPRRALTVFLLAQRGGIGWWWVQSDALADQLSIACFQGKQQRILNILAAFQTFARPERRNGAKF